ncbi:MAG: aminotransferase class V-fold PLP-dependent enzyme, partial [Actinomycetota bacterium]
DRLAEVPGLRVVGPRDAASRGGVVSFVLDDVHPHDVAEILDRHAVCVRAGHHCTQPLVERLGLAATVRASFYLYTATDDVDRLVEGLLDARRVMGV